MVFVKSASVKPTARSIALLGDRCTLRITTLLLKFSGIFFPSLPSSPVLRLY
ncbi:hypothetical protein WKK05_30355 [Nostoc sp. UHCC 0302]